MTASIDSIKKAIHQGESIEDIVLQYYKRIDEREPQINGFLTLCRVEALEKARSLDKRREKGEKLGPLAGIPVAVKDNISTDGLKTTCASKMLEDYIPPYDATVIKRLKEADAIIIGKTNMDEFAMGSSNENSAFKVTSNPWDTKRVPGGSSGGSAAVVAAEMAPLALGSDTGGSIRQPAAFCGVVGLKPTYGMISRFGLIAFASSLDQIGPITTSVKDAALSLEILQGHDPMDSTSYRGEPNRYTDTIAHGIKGMKMAVPKEFFHTKGLDQEIANSIWSSIEKYQKLGAIVEEISMPLMEESLAAYYLISSAEASSNLARFDGVRYGHRTKEYEKIEELIEKSRSEAFGKEVKRRIMMGTYALSSGYYDAYYNRAQKMRQLISQQFQGAFKDYDVIISPTTPILPFLKGEKTNDPLEMYLGDIYTININLAKLPALSMPCGFSEEGLPIGIQLIGNHYSESMILKAAYALEQELALKGPIRKEEV